ncbi:MAG: signal peptidase I [Gemmatimonadetes bacterium 13_1_40CM_2_60_3]|nr:MAG: signal peptidase I [Gemmatimonadetes bacterium 13_1_40CM_2_60_3]
MDSMSRPRSPIAAALLSLVLPGLGEVYAGQPRAALLTFLGYYLLAALGVALIFAPLRGATIALPFVVIVLGWVLVVLRAVRASSHAERPYALRPYNRWYSYLLAIAFSGFVWQPVVFRALTSGVVQAFRVPSAAMSPTILPGDFVFVSKLSKDRVPARNDIVVLSAPTDPRLLVIKRVVGLPGDTLAMAHGVLIRNGAAVAEPFAQLTDSARAAGQALDQGRPWHLAHLAVSGGTKYQPTMRNWGPVVVPNDSLFVLGDNRDDSYDSRFWGAVSTHDVRGRPLAVYLSVGQDGRGRSGVRWNRIGHRF